MNDPVLTELEALATDASVSRALSPAVARVERALAGDPSEPQAWEPVPLEAFGTAVPESIESCWIFLLRSGARFGAERHPNSHQRSVALRGSAVFELREEEVWVPRVVAALEWRSPAHGGVGPAGERSISIPAGTWHRIEIGPENFLSLSFHTVPARELIEETPVGDDLSVTRKRLYHA